ncbi:hypothetical protein F5I97DRAFT_1805697 [Phlebopus sp. FC_14]|nr:hypothetical protein F5I97DRAFT_1805697 [Phlebopus sp. FC_14]
MDLYPPDSQQELRLRMHVREILLPYARTHLTTDHVAFTEYVVEDLLLHNLESVPLADAASFFLPTDPFDLLVRSLDALSLKPYEERWAAPAEIIPYLKSHFPPLPPSCELRNDKCWEEEDHECKFRRIYASMSTSFNFTR